MEIEKTVFISYRRTNVQTAHLIYHLLRNSGFDVFLDSKNINSGDFLQVIQSNILARAHFIIIITPSSLEKLGDQTSVLHREVEYAIDNKRNIIPVILDCYDFSSANELLTDNLKVLTNYRTRFHV